MSKQTEISDTGTKNVKAIVMYDGTRFSGWQSQGNTPNTIQAIVEEALTKALGVQTAVVGASRTDAGVHSVGQTINFSVPARFAANEVAQLANAQLPADIVIHSASETHARFHARYNAAGKTYRYQIWNRSALDPFTRKYSLWVPDQLDLGKMRLAAEQFVGNKDFKAFSTGKTKKSTVKTVELLAIDATDGMISITIRGDGFLYNMVRIIVGTILEAGLRQRDPLAIPAVFASGDRQNAGYTVPAHGLFLDAVYYM